MLLNQAYLQSFLPFFSVIIGLIALAFSIYSFAKVSELRKSLNRIRNIMQSDDFKNSDKQYIYLTEKVKKLEYIISDLRKSENNQRNNNIKENNDLPVRAKPMPQASLRLKPMHDDDASFVEPENFNKNDIIEAKKDDAILELKGAISNSENNINDDALKFVDDFSKFANNPNKSPSEYQKCADKYGKLYNAVFQNDGLKILGEFDPYNEQSYVAVIALYGSNYCFIIPHFNWISSFYGPSASLRHIEDAVSAAFDAQIGEGEMQYKKAAIGKITENGDILVSSRGILYGFKAG